MECMPAPSLADTLHIEDLRWGGASARAFFLFFIGRDFSPLVSLFIFGHFYVRFRVCVRVPGYFQANLNSLAICSVFGSFSFLFYCFSCFVRCCHFAIFLISHPSSLALHFTFADDRSNSTAHFLICEPSFACSFLALLFSVLLAQFRDCALRSCFFWRLPIFILWVYFVCRFTSLVSGVTARAFVLFLRVRLSHVC